MCRFTNNSATNDEAYNLTGFKECEVFVKTSEYKLTMCSQNSHDEPAGQYLTVGEAARPVPNLHEDAGDTCQQFCRSPLFFTLVCETWIAS